MSSTPYSDTDLLLAQGAWIRALARRLVADEHRAEDLVQETWLAALRRRGDPVRALRPYLAGILSNLARLDLRRRGRREREVGLDTEAAAVEAASLGRELADLVLALDEPFRTTILLRYYEDLPPRTIARRMGVPVRTVNSRLARGLERLRAKLKKRTDWTPALILGVASMNAKHVAAVVAAIVLTAGVLVWMRAPAPGPAAMDAAAVAEVAHLEAEPPRSAPLAPSVSTSEDRRAPGAAPVVAEKREDPAAMPVLREVRGRILDPDAVPLAGIEVAFRGGSEKPPLAVSGAGGFFELAFPPADGTVEATDPRLVNVCVGIVRRGVEVEPLVVVAPSHDLAGRVVDSAGAPLIGAEISFEPPNGFMRRFDAVLDSTRRFDAGATTDASGAFALPHVPELPGSRVVARLDGYAPGSIDAPAGNDANLVLALARTAAEGLVLEGTVVDEANHSVAGAHVSLGQRSVVTDSAGEFRLETTDAEDAVELVAVSPGHLPGRLTAQRDPTTAKPVWPRILLLRLAGAPLAITGRVVDGEGKPRPRVRIWIEDPTRFGILGKDDVATVESMLFEGVGAGDDFMRTCWADADGKFAFSGLLDRTYRFGMLDAHTLERVDVGPYAAGVRDVVVVFERAPVRRLSGRVLSSAGHPITGASLSLMAHAFGGVSMAIDDGSRVSDADGRYAFDRVAGTNLIMWVQGDDIVPHMLDVPAAEEFDVRVEVRCHFKIHLTQDAAQADGFLVYDADGIALDLLEIAPGGVVTHHSASLVDGKSAALGVVDRAATLVLTKRDAEVKRIAIHLVPGRLNLIEP